MSLFHQLASLEENDDLHLSRLLVLLHSFAGAKGEGTVEGLTKLAKLDFLLRYPVFLERALARRNVSVEKAQVQDHERTSVESSMVRFRYGPWDFRYRRLLNLLVGKGLVRVELKGRTVQIGLTSVGLQVATKLVQHQDFQDITERAKVLRQHFNINGTALMRFIYDTFPEIATLRYGEEIKS